MKYSDSVKAILLATIDGMAADPETYANKPSKDFTRNRKLGFKRLILMYLTMEGECIREETYKFFGRTHRRALQGSFLQAATEAEGRGAPVPAPCL